MIAGGFTLAPRAHDAPGACGIGSTRTSPYMILVAGQNDTVRTPLRFE
jgi:hypothetical protein